MEPLILLELRQHVVNRQSALVEHALDTANLAEGAPWAQGRADVVLKLLQPAELAFQFPFGADAEAAEFRDFAQEDDRIPATGRELVVEIVEELEAVGEFGPQGDHIAGEPARGRVVYEGFETVGLAAGCFLIPAAARACLIASGRL